MILGAMRFPSRHRRPNTLLLHARRRGRARRLAGELKALKTIFPIRPAVHQDCRPFACR